MNLGVWEFWLKQQKMLFSLIFLAKTANVFSSLSGDVDAWSRIHTYWCLRFFFFFKMLYMHHDNYHHIFLCPLNSIHESFAPWARVLWQLSGGCGYTFFLLLWASNVTLCTRKPATDSWFIVWSFSERLQPLGSDHCSKNRVLMLHCSFWTYKLILPFLFWGSVPCFIIIMYELSFHPLNFKTFCIF